MTRIEILESRIAPASLLDARTIVFTDVDGDEVTMHFSKDVFSGTAQAQLAKANEVFKFDTGNVGSDLAIPQQLRLIDFSKFPVVANQGSTVNGVGLTITAVQKGTGDGLVDVGAIKATGVSLGKVVLDGDLGQVDAGGSGLKIGMAGLTVNSLGKRGTATQIPVPSPTAENPAPDLVSTITGELKSLKVLDDVQDSRVRIVDGKNAQGQITTIAKLGSLVIGGLLRGRTAVEAASDDTGLIECDRDIGAITIGTAPNDGIVGGGGKNSGRISAGGKIASIKISGVLQGGMGADSGTIASRNSVGAATISGDLAGGGGDGSGALRAFGNFASVTVGDDLVAGMGPNSGVITALGTITKLIVKGDLDATALSVGGNAGAVAGGIFANHLPSVIVQNSILGGAGPQSAFIESAQEIGNVLINGQLVGGAGDGSGLIVAHGSLKNVTVKGEVLGGVGKQSAMIRSGFNPDLPGDLGKVTVLGRVVGGVGDNSGAIASGGAAKAVVIGSNATAASDTLLGGAGSFSGTVSARGGLAFIQITGHVQGGDGPQSGSILSVERVGMDGEFAGDLGTVKISGHLAGGAGEKSGLVRADGALGSLTASDLMGGGGVDSGGIRTGEGLFGNGAAGAIRIAGDFTQATVPGVGSASVRIGGALKTMSVNGDVTGASIRVGESAGALSFGGAVSGLTVTALGQAVQTTKSDIALGRIDVRGAVSASSFLAGYDWTGTAINPDAQIGAVIVRGTWTASNLVAGVAAGTDAGFGNEFDVKASGPDTAGIVSTIASVIIGGAVSGAAEGHFGFVAQYVGRMKVGTTAFALNPVADTQHFEVGGTGSGVTIREVPL